MFYRSRSAALGCRTNLSSSGRLNHRFKSHTGCTHGAAVSCVLFFKNAQSCQSTCGVQVGKVYPHFVNPSQSCGGIMLLGVSVLPDFQILPQFSDPPNICEASCVCLHFETLLSPNNQVKNLDRYLLWIEWWFYYVDLACFLTAYAKVANATPRIFSPVQIWMLSRR